MFRKTKKTPKESVETVGPQLLEVCRRSARDLKLIKETLDRCPEAINYRDDDDRGAMHMACSHQPALDVVQCLAHKSPKACRQTTEKGLLPLHYACRENASVEVIMFLIQSHPQGLRHSTSNGWLPLHLACARQATVDVIQLLVTRDREAVLSPTRDGRLALHFACANHAPLEVVELIHQGNPNAVRMIDQNEWTPLHLSCSYCDSLETIQYLVEASGDGLRLKGRKERIPLHVACAERQPLHIIQYLVRQWRASTQQRDANNLLPLHSACQGGAPLEVIQYLISEQPESVFELGQTPIEMACYATQNSMGTIRTNHTPPSDLVEWMRQVVENQSPSHHDLFVPPQAGFTPRTPIIDTPPNAMQGLSRSPEFQMDTNFGNRTTQTLPASQICQPAHDYGAANVSTEFHIQTPMTYPATLGRGVSDGQQEVALDGNPRQPDTRSTQPRQRQNSVGNDDIWSAGQRLHRACEEPQSLRIITELLAEFPQAVEHKAYGMLPIHTACMNKASVDVLRPLCDGYPQALESRDEQGNLPMHLACNAGAPLDSIHFLFQQSPHSIEKSNSQNQTPLGIARNPFFGNPNSQVVEFLGSQLVDLGQRARRREGAVADSPGPEFKRPTMPKLQSPSGRRMVVAPLPMGSDELDQTLEILKKSNKQKRASRLQEGGAQASVDSGPALSQPPRPKPSVPVHARPADHSISPTYSQGRMTPNSSPLPRGRSSRNASPLPTGRSSRNVSPAVIRTLPRGLPLSPAGRSSRNSSPAPSRQGVLPPTATTGQNNLRTQATRPMVDLRRAFRAGDDTPGSRSSSQEPQNRIVGHLGREDQARRRGSASRTFEASRVQEAGAASSQSSLPGAVNVQEPAIRPDSELYRVVHGNINDNRKSLDRDSIVKPPLGVDEVEQTLQALRRTRQNSDEMHTEASGEEAAGSEPQLLPGRGISLVQDAAVFGHSHGMPNASSGRGTSLDAPLSVEEVDNALNALPQSKQDSSRTAGTNELTSLAIGERVSHLAGEYGLPKEVSALYGSAVEGSQIVEGNSREVVRGVAKKPSKTDSFFEQFMEVPDDHAAVDMSQLEDHRKPAAVARKPPPDDNADLSDAKPAAVSRKPAPDIVARSGWAEDSSTDDRKPSPSTGMKKAPPTQSHAEGINREDIPSSFYREAAAASRMHDISPATGRTQDGADDQLNSLYFSAIEQAKESTSPNKFDRQDRRLMAPEDVSPVPTHKSVHRENSANLRAEIEARHPPAAQSSFYRAALEAARRAENPVLVEEEPVKPGAVMVNETAARPDSAMYRVNYGTPRAPSS